MRRVVVSVLALTAACALFVGLHPLTPARTFKAYERKATGTAQSVLSAVETASLTAKLASDHRLFGSYVSVLMSESESGVGGAQTTFDSIQPPDTRADHVRAELGDLMSRAADTLSTLRISARRGETSTLAVRAEPLTQLAKDLNAFIETHH
jgi:hypothetical protein